MTSYGTEREACSPGAGQKPKPREGLKAHPQMTKTPGGESRLSLGKRTSLPRDGTYSGEWMVIEKVCWMSHEVIVSTAYVWNSFTDLNNIKKTATVSVHHAQFFSRKSGAANTEEFQTGSLIF